jgi:two-component system, chemotaxis family, CheB/CheR fusion protein
LSVFSSIFSGGTDRYTLVISLLLKRVIMRLPKRGAANRKPKRRSIKRETPGGPVNNNTDASPQRDDPSAVRAAFPVVGIGASAGGFDALKMFFSAVSVDSGLAFVVVQHLDPAHKSMLPELLGRATPLPVVPISDGMAIERNHVFVIPSDASLTIKEGKLHLAALEPREHRTPIDTFFISLATDRHENAAGVILSGTGSDGTLGLRAIKENGGLTLAQAGAEYDGMMRSAVATGSVDFVVTAQEMPAKLVDYFRHQAEFAGKAAGAVLEQAGDYLQQICAVLRARTGHDFSGYKDKTMVRRIQRRMQVLQIDDMPTFLERLRRDPREVNLLFHDLLIGVTNFFRDREVFQAFEKEVIPRLFEGKGASDTIRVWVTGCSTGEEAYSIAILLREHTPTSYGSPKLQIFATDIDVHALELARVGRYPASIAKDVSTERLQRWFEREDGTYRVTKELRELCLFSTHNVLRDAPFSKLDLISCRNLMIYFTAELQDQLIPLLHYALRDEGYLLLGTSENVGRHAGLFSAVDKTHRIFSRRNLPTRGLPHFPLSTPAPNIPVAALPPIDGSLRTVVERLFLENYAPAYVVASNEGVILHVSGRTGKYLELPTGAPSLNLFGMVRRSLRVDLRTAFRRAVETSEVARQDNIAVGVNGGQQTIDLVVQPIRITAQREPVYMVIFQDIGGIKPARDAEPNQAKGKQDAESAIVHGLEAELRVAKERLQTATEELETSNEELKSSNEELSSINEELQSSNEELETSKEELQSINEELQTVNAELKSRVDELTRANSDMANLLESTQIATIFLDRQLVIKSFTPAAKEVFRLVESDTGRPISHVRSRLKLETLDEDAERVLRTLATIEKKVESSESSARYIMRITPYRTLDNVIAGVVITFLDITQITAAEDRISDLTRDQHQRVESLGAVLDLVPAGISMLKVDGPKATIEINRYAARLFGQGEHKGLSALTAQYRMFDGDRELMPDEQPLQRAARSGETVPDFEGRIVRADGGSVDVIMAATPLFDEQAVPRGAIASMLAISQRKRGEPRQAASRTG